MRIYMYIYLRIYIFLLTWQQTVNLEKKTFKTLFHCECNIFIFIFSFTSFQTIVFKQIEYKKRKNTCTNEYVDNNVKPQISNLFFQYSNTFLICIIPNNLIAIYFSAFYSNIKDKNPTISDFLFFFEQQN